MAKACHPDRFGNRPGAAEAEARMKRLNRAFALLMQELPERPGNAEAEGPQPGKSVPSGSWKGGLFSAFRRRGRGAKKAGRETKTRPAPSPGDAGARPSRPVTRNRTGPWAGPKRQGSSPKRSFEHVLSGACATPGTQAPSSIRVRGAAGDAYSRYIRLKHQMQVQRRRPSQSTVSRVEKISPVRPVPGVGEK